jgi:hypothetical protein
MKAVAAICGICRKHPSRAGPISTKIVACCGAQEIRRKESEATVSILDRLDAVIMQVT